MSSSRMSDRASIIKQVVAPLNSALDKVLKEACRETESLTAHMSYVEGPSGRLQLTPVRAVGAHADIYLKPHSPVREALASRAAATRLPVPLPHTL